MKTDLKDLLTKLKAFFAEDAPPADPKPEGKEVKGKDGATYVVDKLEVGGLVQIKGEADALTPAAAGSIELEDGQVLTVDEAGVITEVKPVEVQAAEDPKPEDAPPAESVSKADFDALAEKVNALSQAVEMLSTANGEFKTQNEGLKKQNEKFSLTLKAAYEVIDAIANESSEDPTSKKKTNPFKKSTNEKEAAFAGLKDAFNAAFPAKK